MNENLKDILSHLNPDIDQETLLLYLQGKLSPEKQHEVEKGLMDDPFETEAMEGLQHLGDPSKIHTMVEQLNADLKKKTEKKKAKRRLRELNIDPWIIAAVFIILILIVIGFVVIRRMKGN